MKLPRVIPVKLTLSKTQSPDKLATWVHSNICQGIPALVEPINDPTISIRACIANTKQLHDSLDEPVDVVHTSSTVEVEIL